MRLDSSTEIIKFELIKCCISFDAKHFIPFLMSKNVTTGMPNKTKFYQFFKYMINCSKQSSFGKLTYKLEYKNDNLQEYYLNFYDEYHKYSRLSIKIVETEKTIFIDTLPF